MAVSNFTDPALGFSSSILPAEFSSRLFCFCCASNSIPIPGGATPRTTFTCRACCDALRKARDPQTAAHISEIGAGIDARLTRESFVVDVRGENLD